MSYSWDKDSVSKTLLHSSHTAIDMQKNLQIFEKQFNNSTEVYTNVDVHIENLIVNSLNAKQQTAVLGEESLKDLPKDTDFKSLLKNALVIDPIDGTNNFINSLPNWAISVGIVENCEFTQGGIALPVLGELYVTDQSYLKHLDDENEKNIYAHYSQGEFSPQTEPKLFSFTIPPITSNKYKIYSSSFKLPHHTYRHHSVRSCVYSIAKVISGSYFAYAGSAKIWDFAACIAIFRALKLEVYCYHKDSHTLSVLPWKITDEHWIDYIYTRYPLIFAPSHAHAMDLL